MNAVASVTHKSELGPRVTNSAATVLQFQVGSNREASL